MQCWKTYLYILIISGTTVPGMSHNNKVSNNIYIPEILCYGTDSNSFVRILPENKNLLKKTNLNDELIFIGIYNDLPIEVINAVEYAFDQWKLYFSSPIPIRVSVSMDDLGDGVLASASPTGFFWDFNGSKPFILYPTSLAEKISRSDLNGTLNSDIRIRIMNNDSLWYYGTDGLTPAGKYDFVSVFMHELAHGMGFTGSIRTNEVNEGVWGYYDTQPAVFDIFLYNGLDEQIINETLFKNPSVDLKNQITNDDLFFHSFVNDFNNPDLSHPKLYTPSDFDRGSSIYHLDYDTYPSSGDNALMVHARNTAEAIHIPGPIVVNMMEEMGWKSTFIEHTKKKDLEEVYEPITFKVKIHSDNPPILPKNLLFFKTHDSIDFDSTYLYIEETGEYANQVIINDTNIFVKYFIKSYDSYGRVFKKPENAPDSVFTFFIGSDTIFPEFLGHDPIPYLLLNKKKQIISGRFFDNLGIDTVEVMFTVSNDSETYTFGMKNDSMDVYTGYFKFDTINLEIGDTIHYNFRVSDKSKNKNTVIFNNESMYFIVEETVDPQIIYEQDFNNFTQDFIGALETDSTEKIKFQISVPEDFDNGCLHTPNPYKNTGNSNYYEYITQLRVPIILQSVAAMRFDEIVLVEPGETGTVFGSEEFWDYVVVEASKDSGTTWHYLQNGYDSRKNSTWISAYRSSFDTFYNSITRANPSMYVSNRIDFLENGNFFPGDTVFVRFRLVSDAYRYGWGWAIDNLDIQGPTSIEQLPFDNAQISVYPNPVADRVYYNIHFENPIPELHVILYDLHGRNLKQSILYNQNNITSDMDMSDLPSGIYVLMLRSQNQSKVFKLIKYN